MPNARGASGFISHTLPILPFPSTCDFNHQETAKMPRLNRTVLQVLIQHVFTYRAASLEGLPHSVKLEIMLKLDLPSLRRLKLASRQYYLVARAYPRHLRRANKKEILAREDRAYSPWLDDLSCLSTFPLCHCPLTSSRPARLLALNTSFTRNMTCNLLKNKYSEQLCVMLLLDAGY